MDFLIQTQPLLQIWCYGGSAICFELALCLTVMNGNRDV